MKKSPIELPNDEGCDATKMIRELKLVTNDCFGFASQDDSPQDTSHSTTAGQKIFCILISNKKSGSNVLPDNILKVVE